MPYVSKSGGELRELKWLREEKMKTNELEMGTKRFLSLKRSLQAFFLDFSEKFECLRPIRKFNNFIQGLPKKFILQFFKKGL